MLRRGCRISVRDFTAMLRTIALATIVASKLPKPAAALEAIDPSIIAGHLQQMRDQVALP
jgi:hypothetical protein